MNGHDSHHKNFFKELFRNQKEDREPISEVETNQFEHTILDYYESFAQLHPDIILIFSLKGKIISPLRRLNEYLGYGLNEDNALKKLMTKAYYDLVRDAFEKASTGTTKKIKICLVDKGGEQIHFQATFIPIKRENGSVESVFLRLKDVTEKKLLEKSNQLKTEQMIELNDDYKHVFNHLTVGIWMAESFTGVITFASDGLAEILQVPLLQIYEEPDYWKKMIHPKYRDIFFKHHKRLNQGESIGYTYLITDGNGEDKWIYEETIPRLDDTGEITHLFGMLTDITEEEKMSKNLRFLAKHDALTGLPNYHLLDDTLDAMIKNEETETLALLYLEIDNFHWIIDYLGYQIGDLVLKQIAERLKALLPIDGYLAKMDRDSFVFLLGNYEDENKVTQTAEAIMEVIGNEITVAGYEFYVTASIGIGFYPHNGGDKLTLMENAHTALYYAKHLGKNNVQVYSFDRDISAHKKYILERDLRGALQNEEFELYYQPQVDPKSGEIRSVEALIRWQHKDWGTVAPDEFISIAEEKHLIHQMEDWVFRSVCKQIRLWKDQGLSVCQVSLNLSPLRFLKPGFVKNAKQALADYDIAPENIELEITESTLLEDKKNIEQTLETMKKLGLTIALDDFGKGYSSFHYLQKYDVDTIKIDKMFIQQLGSADKKNESIVNSIIQLAKALDVRVVAEGVEELDQLAFLKEHACDLIQGYLYSKPVPADQLAEMLRGVYLKPNKQTDDELIVLEKREQDRFVFPKHLQAEMNILEVRSQEMSMGVANILIENMSEDGLRFLTSLRLPISSNLKLAFHFTLLGESFEVEGEFVYKVDEKMDIFSYGVKLHLEASERERLKQQIHTMRLSQETESDLLFAHMVEEDPYVYLRRNRM